MKKPKEIDYDKVAYNKLYKMGHRNIISQPSSEKYRQHYDEIDWNDNKLDTCHSGFKNNGIIPIDTWNIIVGRNNGLCANGHGYYYWWGQSDLTDPHIYGYNCPECERLAYGDYSLRTKEIFKTGKY